MDYYGLNELPETHKRYKTFTNRFEGWLMAIAKQREPEIAAQAEAAARAAASKQKKKNGSSRSYQIQTRDLIPLAQAVAESGMPSDDVSGLKDLNDAIRLRKEVTEYYRQKQESDEQHPFFTSILTDVRTIFKNWIFHSTKPSGLESAHNPPRDNKNSNMDLPLPVTPSLSDQAEGLHDSDDGTATNIDGQAGPTRSKGGTGFKNHLTSRNSTEAGLQASEIDIEMDREFEVLCFLYDLYMLRQRVKQIWSDWVQHKIGTMTAAIVSDLAMAQIQSWVMKLAEDVDDDGSNQEVLAIVDKFTSLIPEDQRGAALSYDKNELPVDLRNLLCYDGIRYMREFWNLNPDGVVGALNLEPVDAFRLQFLLHFKSFSLGEMVAKDRFTESFCSSEPRPRVWLPFGFQILIDVQDLLLFEDSMQKISADVFNYSEDMVEIMKAHIDYEDAMWDKGDKPDYMSLGDSKFSNQFIPILNLLRHWLLKLSNEDSEAVSDLLNIRFFAAHPILCGLTMWYFHTTYHSEATRKIQWFTVALAHLYNACRQIGGLTDPWVDLEFIIHSQGPARVYVGGPPTDPGVFYQRMCLALCGSPRGIAKDSRKDTRLNPAMKQKRGLASFYPLEERISEYYNTTSHAKRSLHLHNIFAFLKNDLQKVVVKGSEASSSTKTLQLAQVNDKVRLIFATIAKKRALSTKNKKARKKNRSKIPELSSRESDHHQGLDHATSQLADHELYGNFDHLAFFRRAYTIMTRIRTEILWDGSQALVTLEAAQEPPEDAHLLYDLLFDLIPPQNKNDTIRASAYVSGMEKMKRISALLQEFIREQGGLEFKNAKEQLKQRREHSTEFYRKDPVVSSFEATPVKDTASCHEPPVLDDEFRSAMDANSEPEVELRQSTPDVASQPKIFRFGKDEQSTFDFEHVLPDRSNVGIVANSLDEAFKPTAVESHALEHSRGSDTEDVLMKSEVDSRSKDMFNKLEAASKPEGPEFASQGDGTPKSVQSEARSLYQGRAAIAVKGKPSMSRIGIASPTTIQTLVDQGSHGGCADWSAPDEIPRGKEYAGDRDSKEIESRGPPPPGLSVSMNQLEVQYELSHAFPTSKDRFGVEHLLPHAGLYGRSAEAIRSEALRSPGSIRAFGVYHRFIYRTARSTRRKKIPSKIYRRFLCHAATTFRPRCRLVGARKHRINHNCYGRCVLGHAFLVDNGNGISGL